MRYTTYPLNNRAICLAIYGCSSLEKVTDFINGHPLFVDGAGATFTASQLAGQYAFEQVKLDRKGYDSVAYKSTWLSFQTPALSSIWKVPLLTLKS